MRIRKLPTFRELVTRVCCMQNQIAALMAMIAGGTECTIEGRELVTVPIPATATEVTVPVPAGYTIGDAGAAWINRLGSAQQLNVADRNGNVFQLDGSPNASGTHELVVDFIRITCP